MKFRDLFRAASKDASTATTTSSSPSFATIEVLLRQAQTLQESGHLPQAIEHYDRIIAQHADLAEPYYKRGNAHNRAGEWLAALADYDQALARNARHAYAFCNRGTVLERLQRWEEALASYDQALALDPADALAHYNRASVLRQLQRLEEAVASYDRAIALNGSYVQAYVNRGNLLHTLARHELAAASYARALELCPLSFGSGTARPQTELRPEQKFVVGLRRHVLMQICDWQGMSSDLQLIADGLRRQLPMVYPLPALSMLDDPDLQRAAAETWVREECPADHSLPAIVPRPRSPKIRVGYFSGDFRQHPVAHLTAGVFEHHDRSRFELTAFSFGTGADDPMRKRIQGAFDRFLDVRHRSDLEIVSLARDSGIDIAVNLSGITEQSRTRVFALRAAPIQISFLGYAGTMGAPYMDYLVADAVVIPPEQQTRYLEKILYLPDSFMPFDAAYVISARVFTRAELGLPEQAFVLCCFNNVFKFTPEIFDIWMRLLARHLDAVLWLPPTNPVAIANLRKEASRRGVEGERLIFATRLDSLPDHLARLRAADLFLDSFPYNAHSTAVDALWAGLPLLTCAGNSFVSRVASSLLLNVGLPELITRSLVEYEDAAEHLMKNPSRLRHLRAVLARNRTTATLFDTTGYTRRLESAYQAVYDRQLVAPQA